MDYAVKCFQENNRARNSLFCSTDKPELNGLDQHFQATAHFPLASSINKFSSEKNWEFWESNQGLHGENRVCYLFAKQPPKKLSFTFELLRDSKKDPFGHLVAAAASGPKHPPGLPGCSISGVSIPTMRTGPS